MPSSRLLYLLMAGLSLAVALVSYRFLVLGMDAAFRVLQVNVNADRMVFATHVIASPVALTAGLMQFLPRLRARRPGLHRLTGRVYAIAVLFGGVSGLLLAASALDRPVAAAGFSVLAVIWLVITARGVLLARAGRLVLHRKWMIRSFALSFAAVTLRLQLPLLFSLGMQYPEASSIVAWTCWVPNLLVAQWLLGRLPRVA